MTTYIDKKGYERDEKEHTTLVHRNRAYHIYLESKKKYPLPYSAYEVHHIDFNKNNNKVSNLAILTPTEHDRIHEEKRKEEERIQEARTQKMLEIQEKRIEEENRISKRKINEEKQKLRKRKLFIYGSIIMGLLLLVFFINQAGKQSRIYEVDITYNPSEPDFNLLLINLVEGFFHFSPIVLNILILILLFFAWQEWKR